MISLEPVLLRVPLASPVVAADDGSELTSLDVRLVRASSGEAVAYGEAAPVVGDDFAPAVEFLADLLAHADPTDFDLLWQRLAWAVRDYRPQPAPAYAAALSAVDMALWDLAGQRFGGPCWRLLGGAKAQVVDCYLSGLRADRADLEREVKRQRERFGALQLRLCGDTERDVAAARLLRRLLGDNAPLRLDGGATCRDAESALSLSQALEPLEVFWLQDPLPPGNWEAWGRVSAQLPCALAGGRDLLGPEAAVAALGPGAVDVLTPDVRLCGGLSGGRRLGDLAWAHGAAISFAGGPSPLGQLAAVHLSAATMNAGPVEVTFPREPLGGLLDPALALREGFFTLPAGPGLGCRVSEHFVDRHQVEALSHE